MKTGLLLCSVAAVLWCSSCNCDGTGEGDAGGTGGGAAGGGGGSAFDAGGGRADAGSVDGGATDAGRHDAAFADSGTPDASVRPAYAIVVCQSPPGPDNGNPATWGGVLQFVLPSDGGALVPLAGIDAGALRDPASVTFRASTSELFIGNRHGNNAADGVAGSVSRFLYAPTTRTFIANGTITGNGLSGVHQLAFNPINGELFAANVNAGVSRFLFVDGGVVANGTISSGPSRGVYVSRNGARLFVTGASNVVRQFDLDAGTELATLTVPSPSAQLHELHASRGLVYASGLGDNLVSRFVEGADGTLTFLDSFTASAPLSTVVDPTGLELYSAGHRASDIIERFVLDGGGWTPVASYPTGFSLGGIELLQ